MASAKMSGSPLSLTIPKSSGHEEAKQYISKYRTLKIVAIVAFTALSCAAVTFGFLGVIHLYVSIGVGVSSIIIAALFLRNIMKTKQTAHHADILLIKDTHRLDAPPSVDTMPPEHQEPSSATTDELHLVESVTKPLTASSAHEISVPDAPTEPDADALIFEALERHSIKTYENNAKTFKKAGRRQEAKIAFEKAAGHYTADAKELENLDAAICYESAASCYESAANQFEPTDILSSNIKKSYFAAATCFENVAKQHREQNKIESSRKFYAEAIRCYRKANRPRDVSRCHDLTVKKLRKKAK